MVNVWIWINNSKVCYYLRIINYLNWGGYNRFVILLFMRTRTVSLSYKIPTYTNDIVCMYLQYSLKTLINIFLMYGNNKDWFIKIKTLRGISFFLNNNCESVSTTITSSMAFFQLMHISITYLLSYVYIASPKRKQ